MKSKSMFLDLHGFPVMDALQAFADEYRVCLKTKEHDAIQVNHGYGSGGIGGEIRIRLRQLLKKAKIEYTCGEDIDLNFGMTIIHIKDKDIDENTIKQIGSVVTEERLRRINEAIAAERNALHEVFIPRSVALETKILEFCTSGKAKSKIVSKFISHYRLEEIDIAIKRLKQGNKLKVISDRGLYIKDGSSI